MLAALAAAFFPGCPAAAWRSGAFRPDWLQARGGQPLAVRRGAGAMARVSPEKETHRVAGRTPGRQMDGGLGIQQPSAKIRTVRQRFASLEEETLLAASLEGSFSETERLTICSGRPRRRSTKWSGSGRAEDGCPPFVPVLSFFADNLAWAMACPP